MCSIQSLSKNIARFFIVKVGIWIIVFFLGCYSKPIPVVESRMWELHVFSTRLPFNEPERCLKMIKDSARNQEELAALCETLMYQAENVEAPETYFELLDGIKKALKHVDENMQAKIDMHTGYKYLTSGRYDSAIFFFNKSLPIYEKINDVPHVSENLRLLARTYSDKDNLVAANDYAIRNLEILQKYPQSDWHDKYYALSVLGDCSLRSRHYQKAKEFHLMALVASNQLDGEYYSAIEWEGLSDVYAALKQPDSALIAAQKGEELMLETHSADLIPNTFLRLGVAYRLKKNYPLSLTYLQNALYSFDSLKYNIFAVVVSAQIAYNYQAQGDLHMAEKWCLETLARLQKVNKPGLEASVLDSLAILYFRNASIDEGLKLLSYAKKITDSIYSIENQQLLENLNLKYETAQREQRIRELRYAQQSIRMQALIATLLFLLALGAIAFLIHTIRQRRLLQIQETLQAAAREDKYQLELANAKLQLDKFMQHILSKNQLIEELESRFLINDALSREALAEFKLHKAELTRAQMLTEDDWREYVDYFEQVHSGLIGRFKIAYNDLTKGDIRLFMLMRQGFDIREIIQILAISLLGVKKARYRLRKKMGLAEDENLEFAVKNF